MDVQRKQVEANLSADLVKHLQSQGMTLRQIGESRRVGTAHHPGAARNGSDFLLYFWRCSAYNGAMIPRPGGVRELRGGEYEECESSQYGASQISPLEDPDMYGIELNREIINACKRILLFVPGLQTRTRTQLVNNLQSICDKCEGAYAAFRKRLAPVKASYANPRKLAKELRSFAADDTTRSAFKPDHLCGEIDHLLDALASWVSPLPFSVNLTGLGPMKTVLERIGNFDGALRHEYDEFTRELDAIAEHLETADPHDVPGWVEYVKALVAETSAQLSNAVDDVHKAKAELLRAAR
ncbi:MAG: hypothetical protein RBR19_16390 [Sedimentisphaerales bacterium]|nr:hypothetical protein [Planctomycetota bacterium]MDY0357461.1 hypothetical protein [Sedimentisphaerales bacterium]